MDIWNPVGPNIFKPQQQSDGHWDQQIGAHASVIGGAATFTNVATVTSVGGQTFPANTCNTLVTNSGKVTFTSADTHIVGVGTSFSAGDWIVIFGTFSGVYGKEAAQIVTVVDGTHLTTSQPIYLDTATGSGVKFQIVTTAGLSPGLVVVLSNSSGVVQPMTNDPNWYTCVWNNSTQVTLDTPYVNASPFITGVFLSSPEYTINQGAQAFMEISSRRLYRLDRWPEPRTRLT